MRPRLPLALSLVALLLATGCARNNRPLTPEDVMSSPEARLRSIILTNVEIQNARIEEAVRYLTEQSRQADPDKAGVSITYRHFTLQDRPYRISLKMPQATLMQALDEVCRQGHCNYLIAKDHVAVMSEGYMKPVGPPRRYDAPPY